MQKLLSAQEFETYETAELFGHTILLYGGRLFLDEKEKLQSQFPGKLYFYELRGSDDDPGYPVTVEHRVYFNFVDTILIFE